MKTAYHIAIEGTIGVGKTSLAKLLAERLDGRLVLEKFDENPFLGEFYKDPDHYAFQTQLWFLLSRYRQQQDLQQMDLFTSALEKNIVQPDLVIFLQSDTERLMENIKKRGRDYEVSMDWKYIDALNQIYNEYFFRYDKSPLLIINSNDIDFVNNDADLDSIFEFIRTPGQGTRYFNPLKSI
jgi:deoxyguanosine kinase